jgi:hypothetical protein
MAALHEQRGKGAGEPFFHPDGGGHGGGKDLFDGFVYFFRDVEFFHAALAQLGVTHDLGDDTVGVGDLLLDDLDLEGGGIFIFADGAFERVGGVADDGERIFDLVG